MAAFPSLVDIVKRDASDCRPFWTGKVETSRFGLRGGLQVVEDQQRFEA